VLDPTDYTLEIERTTVVADRDKDGVPDVADKCKGAKGPSTGAGCPDRDGDLHFDKLDRCPTDPGTASDGCPTKASEKVVALVDGKQVDARWIMTKHGSYQFALLGKVGQRRTHELVLTWYDGRRVVKSVERTF
jgi:hypothetical protein